MQMNKLELWQRYKDYVCDCETLGLSLDISRMSFGEAFFEEMSGPIKKAFLAMDAIEGGAKANVSEDRMVGHYWLRAPELAPNDAIRTDIKSAINAIKAFASGVHEGSIKPQRGDGFYVVLVVGIGGSALGPQLVSDALGSLDDQMIVRFIDNTDPDGIDRILGELDESIAETLTLVVSKSGGTKETRNAMLEVATAYKRSGLDFAKHAVAVTASDSTLHRQATGENWLATFPMWDWVGGRTSVMSSVGLLPAALQGIDIDAFLAGARECDALTRSHDTRKNPASLLALMWYFSGDGCGSKDMVVLPYKDRLSLFARYLQQLVMESVGKKEDRTGKVVHQGLTVYGNKGSTDQHAFVQQLRDGRDDFFVTFIDVLQDRQSDAIDVEKGLTAGDYLHGFLYGTRDALCESGRDTMTITLDGIDARSLGCLIALFERAVGLYAELINVNAYDQPGVEAGKKAATAILDIKKKMRAVLEQGADDEPTPEEVAEKIGHPDDVELVHHLMKTIAPS
jgi:glucose-6-phosphate isomerase